jgi:hypothetical protein
LATWEKHCSQAQSLVIYGNPESMADKKGIVVG